MNKRAKTTLTFSILPLIFVRGPFSTHACEKVVEQIFHDGNDAQGRGTVAGESELQIVESAFADRTHSAVVEPEAAKRICIIIPPFAIFAVSLQNLFDQGERREIACKGIVAASETYCLDEHGEVQGRVPESVPRREPLQNGFCATINAGSLAIALGQLPQCCDIFLPGPVAAPFSRGVYLDWIVDRCPDEGDHVIRLINRGSSKVG